MWVWISIGFLTLWIWGVQSWSVKAHRKAYTALREILEALVVQGALPESSLPPRQPWEKKNGTR